VVVNDPAGDTVVDGSQKAKAEGRADLLQGRAIYHPEGIALTAQTAQRGDPSQDPSWASTSTFVSWELDTNGDSKPDFEVQFFLEDGIPVAGVSRVGDNVNNSVCDAGARYTAENYVVGIDPACFGSPAQFSYRVSLYYDTDPADEDADVLTDVTPNGGLSRPVARPAG
jgi:hypothetical protein